MPKIRGCDQSLRSETRKRYVLLFLLKRLQIVDFYHLLTSIVLYRGSGSGYFILCATVEVSTSAQSAFCLVLGKHRYRFCSIDTRRMTAIERFSPRTKRKLLSPLWNTYLWYEVYVDVSNLFLREIFGKNCTKDCCVIAISTLYVHLLYLLTHPHYSTT